MYWISEPFLYVGYSLLAGMSVFALVPNTLKPKIKYPSWLGPAASAVVAISAFIPILQIIMFFKEDIGFYQSFKAVMFNFKEGERYAWIVALSLLAAALSVLVRRRPGTPLRWLFPLAVLGIAAAMSSFNHAASLFGVTGELAFFGHFTAMALWTGTLIIVGFCSQSTDGWRAFLKWFHPLAIICVLIVVASGLFLMTGVAPDLVKSWILPYGQALLLKHILILPLLAFAFINGGLMKKRLVRDPQAAKPAVWARTEAMLLWLIYIVTGYMNQQPAPHAYTESLAQSDAAATFRWFHPGYQGGGIGWEWSVPGVLLLLCGVVCLGGMILMFVKKNRAGKVLLLALAATAFLYAGIMFSFA